MVRGRKPIVLLVAMATIALAATIASSAFAGFAADPNIGDKQLGRNDGIAYVKDAETVVDTGSTLASAGCPGKGDAWRVAGGGFDAGHSFNLINMSRPLDHSDADTAPDDYWEVESNSADGGTKITSYAICMKEPKLKYVSAVAPDSATSERKLSVDCPGKSEPISGGGSISHSDSFLTSLYSKGGTWTAAVHDFNAGTGNFTADAVCLRSKRLERVPVRPILIDPVTQVNIKILCEAPAQPMGSLYQLIRPTLGPDPTFASFPIDGNDKDRIPDDGMQIGVKNTTTEPVTVRASAMCYDTRPGIPKGNG